MGTRYTGELLYIDQHILNDGKTRRKNRSMAMYDSLEKAYLMVLQNCIIACHKMYKISGELMNFIENIMKNWRVENLNSERDLSGKCAIIIILFTSTSAPLGEDIIQCQFLSGV